MTTCLFHFLFSAKTESVSELRTNSIGFDSHDTKKLWPETVKPTDRAANQKASAPAELWAAKTKRDQERCGVLGSVTFGCSEYRMQKVAEESRAGLQEDSLAGGGND